MKFRYSQRGIGLLELMLSLAIIAILLVMATRYFASARQGQQVAALISQLQAIAAASQSYAVGHNNSSSGVTLSGLSTGGYLPGNVSTVTPWNGTITVKPGGVPSYPAAVEVIVTTPNTAVCSQIAGAAKALATPGQTASCSGTTVTATIGG